MIYLETPRPNTNRYVHAHKCLHCAGIEPASSCVVGEHSHHYAKSAVMMMMMITVGEYYNYFLLNPIVSVQCILAWFNCLPFVSIQVSVHNRLIWGALKTLVGALKRMAFQLSRFAKAFYEHFLNYEISWAHRSPFCGVLSEILNFLGFNDKIWEAE
jgi:hypothetical protein